MASAPQTEYCALRLVLAVTLLQNTCVMRLYRQAAPIGGGMIVHIA